MLEADRGPSPFCRLHSVAKLSKDSSLKLTGALPFLLIVFGGDAIKGLRISMLEADRGPSPFCRLHLSVMQSKV